MTGFTLLGGLLALIPAKALGLGKRKVARRDPVEEKLEAIANQVAEIDSRLSLTGRIEGELAAMRDAIEGIGRQLAKTEPRIASRIEQLENALAEIKRGREYLGQ